MNKKTRLFSVILSLAVANSAFSQSISRHVNPLWDYSEKTKNEFVKKALVDGDEKNYPDPKKGPMSQAAIFGYDDILLNIFSSQKNANSIDEREALYFAASMGRLSTVIRLTELGADVNAEIDNGLTAIWGSVDYGELPVTCYLVEKGADVNHLSEMKASLLQLAALSGNRKIFKLILSSGYTVQPDELKWVKNYSEKKDKKYILDDFLSPKKSIKELCY